MKGLKSNWRVVALMMGVVFLIGVGCLFYFSNRDNGGDVVEFEAFNMTENVSSNEAGENKANNAELSAAAKEEIYVHIVGEVKNEGVITLEKGKRIVDAIDKAGGVTEEADLSKVNLAYVLSDGQKVRIPSVNDEINISEEYVITGGGSNVIYGGGGSSIRKVNINTASQTELETISGVGPSLAAKIISYREKNGKFKNVEELKNVSGIGDSKFEGMKDFVDV